MLRVLMGLMALTLASPGAALATHCHWVIDPGSAVDVVSAVNREDVSDDVEFHIFDNQGNERGSVTSPQIPSGGRFDTTVGDIYAGAGVPTTLLKQTYILAIEGANFETILQVKTGGGTFQPRHFNVDFAGTGNCDSQ